MEDLDIYFEITETTRLSIVSTVQVYAVVLAFLIFNFRIKMHKLVCLLILYPQKELIKKWCILNLHIYIECVELKIYVFEYTKLCIFF